MKKRNVLKSFPFIRVLLVPLSRKAIVSQSESLISLEYSGNQKGFQRSLAIKIYRSWANLKKKGGGGGKKKKEEGEEKEKRRHNEFPNELSSFSLNIQQISATIIMPVYSVVMKISYRITKIIQIVFMNSKVFPTNHTSHVRVRKKL